MAANVNRRGVPHGHTSGTAVLDLEKAFEHVSMYLLWAEAPKHGFSPQLRKLLIPIYTARCFVSFRGVASQHSAVTFSAVVAGSTGGNSLS